MLSILCACNKDGEIEVPETKEPQVVFENGTGVYQVKVMKSVTVTPTVIDAVNPKYRWLDDKGKTVGQELSYTFSS
ncbi:PKD-like domain-containing protein, partial [Duncaniella muris]